MSLLFNVQFMKRVRDRGNASLKVIRITGFDVPIEFDSTTRKLKDWLDLKPKLQQYAQKLMLLIAPHPNPARPTEVVLSALPGEQSSALVVFDHNELTSSQEGDDAIRSTDSTDDTSICEFNPLTAFDFDEQCESFWI
jgi:hypothetical protein